MLQSGHVFEAAALPALGFLPLDAMSQLFGFLRCCLGARLAHSRRSSVALAIPRRHRLWERPPSMAAVPAPSDRSAINRLMA